MLPHQPTYGRQLRLFLADGTSSGPRFIEIFNRTIQALAIPANRLQEVYTAEWVEFHSPGVYVVAGATEGGSPRLYVGKGENVAKRVQAHPEGLAFEIRSLLLFSSKDRNLNASQVSWLESSLIRAGKEAKRTTLTNVQVPEFPALSKAELATVAEFFEDLKLIAQTAEFDFFSPPKQPIPTSGQSASLAVSAPPSPEFTLNQPQKKITARGNLSDEGFVVHKGSDACLKANDSLGGTYVELRDRLIEQGVLVVNPADTTKMSFTVDYPFSAPSPAAAIVIGNNTSGLQAWKTANNLSLGDYLKSLEAAAVPTAS